MDDTIIRPITSIAHGASLNPRKRVKYWRFAFAAILTFAAIVYFPSVNGVPFWDDKQLIGRFTSFKGCFTRPFLEEYFRPLVSVSFFIDWKLWKIEPFAYHQTNILLHVIGTAFLMLTVCAAFGSRRIALLSGLLFAIQPTQVSAVAWIGGRTDALCEMWVAVFAWTLICSAQASGLKRLLLLGASTTFYAMALLTKEQSLALLPLVPMAFRCFSPSRAQKECKTVWLATLLYVLVSLAFVGLWLAIGPPLLRPAHHDLVYAANLGGRTLTYYALVLLAPTPQWLHCYTIIPLENAGLWTLLFGFILLSASLLLIARCIRTQPAFAWFLALSILAILPVSNLLPLHGQILAPYRAGLAGLGVATVFGYVLGRDIFMRQNPTITSQLVFPLALWRSTIGALLVVWGAGLTAWDIQQWQDELRVLTTYERYDPNSLFVREFRARALMVEGSLDKSSQEIETLLTWLFQGSAWQHPIAVKQAYLNDPGLLARLRASNGDRVPPLVQLLRIFCLLGDIHYCQTHYVEAQQAYRSATELYPNNIPALTGMAGCAKMAKRWAEAQAYLEKAIRIKPTIAELRVSLGHCLTVQGNLPQAMKQYRMAIRLTPKRIEGYVCLADVEMKLGEKNKAMETLMKAQQHVPSAKGLIQTRLNIITRMKAIRIPPNGAKFTKTSINYD